MSKRICPLLSIATATITPTHDPADCMGPHCAWWDYLACDCCLVAIADSIRDAVEAKEADQ